MKILKNQFLFLLMILSTCYSYAQEPATIVMGMVPETNGANKLVTALKGQITSTTWNEDYVLIEMQIVANDVSLEVVKHLISRERFCIKTKYLDNGNLILFMPNFELPVFINGQRLSEDISYQVFVPEGVVLKVNTFEQFYPCLPQQEIVAKILEKIVPSSLKSETLMEEKNASL